MILLDLRTWESIYLKLQNINQIAKFQIGCFNLTHFFWSGSPDFGVPWIFSKIWIYSVWKNPSLIVLIMKVINFQSGSEMKGSQEITSGIKIHFLWSHVEFYMYSVYSIWSSFVWKERWYIDDVITERHFTEITLLEKSWHQCALEKASIWLQDC